MNGIMSSLLGLGLCVIYLVSCKVFGVMMQGPAMVDVVHNALLGGCSFPRRNITDCRSLH